MDEDQLWKIYRREVAEMERLEGDFLNASEGENQIGALAHVEKQSGRLEILRELLTTIYTQTEFGHTSEPKN